MTYRLLLFVTATLLAFNALAQLATQKSSANGVTVAVTPGKFAAEAKTWDFAIVLDTHSQDLSDDLAKSAVLTDDRGNEFKALAWEGAAPGGHHRTGVLRFNAIEPRPRAIGLRISRPGEAQARTFRWQLAAP
ncbi:MAG TPA: hypothetical protein VFZ81_07515 [Burkholderiales bacterium]